MPRHTDFDPSAFTNAPFVVNVEKPWGYELIFTPPEKGYCGKILHVTAGKRLSLQYHDQKEETIMLLRGKALLLCDNEQHEIEEIAMEQGKGYSNVPGQRHRLYALEDSDFIEASLRETGMTYRLEDDSGRSDETEAMRAQERAR